MASFSITKRVAAPVETVFDMASDIERAAGRIRGITKIELLTPPPVGVGTEWRETRQMMGREATELMKFTAFDRPHNLTIGCHSCGTNMEMAFRFTPVQESGGWPATDVTVDTRAELQSRFAKLFAPLLRPMFKKMMRGCLESDLEGIKTAAESAASHPVEAAIG